MENEDQRQSQSEKAKNYWLKAQQLSEKKATLELPIAYSRSWGWKAGTDESFKIFNKALEYSREAKDKLLTGGALERLAVQAHWNGDTTEDSEERAASYDRWLRYANEAKQEYTPISFVYSALFSDAPHSHYYWHLADLETDRQKRRSLLQKAVDAARNQVKTSNLYPYPNSVFNAHRCLYMALTDLAKTETNSEEKTAFLKEALEHAEETVKKSYGIETYDHVNQGINHSFLGDIRVQLAKLANDSESRKKLLEDAVSNKEAAVKFLGQEIRFHEKTGSTAVIARMALYQRDYGDSLILLYEQSHNKEHLRRAAKAFDYLAELFQKGNFASRMAECYWKAAQTYDTLEEYWLAAEKFSQASDGYRTAAEKIPQLNSFYRDHGLYMEAWREIEKARHHHAREEYALAREFYDKSAALHKSTSRWDRLMTNYSALAQIENAEDCSRKEDSENAIRGFQKAAQLFAESKASLQGQLNDIEDADERSMTTRLIKASELRQEFCTARIILEEARMLDKQGDHYSSSRKYGEAAEILGKIFNLLEFEHTKKEIKLIMTLAKAWEKMTQAEVEASPKLCLEAAQLFEEAKDISPNEKTKMLILGHNKFCRALEAGTRFADTGDGELHAVAMQHLVSAAKYYAKAGFETASGYAEATGLLFDAYLRMDQAKKERDEDKRAKLYLVAERILQASADSYQKAGYPGKRDHVLKLLEMVKREQALALSIAEVLHVPSILSTTTAFSTPTPIHERAVGLERFEHADVQASIITRRKHLNVGENLELEIELVNAGNGPAQLVKVEDLIPPGFELTTKPEHYRVEDSYLNMRGKRLDPLKTEEIQLVLKAKNQGQFAFKPRILYLDESGRYRSHEPESKEITVKELGISGWLKGR